MKMKCCIVMILFIFFVSCDGGSQIDENDNEGKNDIENYNDDNGSGVLPGNDQDKIQPDENSEKVDETEVNDDTVQDLSDNAETTEDVDVIDLCPENSLKIEPGICGCDVDDIDSDGDGLMDCVDNCVDTQNIDQVDIDNDRRGDACDNCPYHANIKQIDTDGNDVGDACENDTSAIDTDSDGILDYADNCISIVNSDQTDADGDGIGDSCDNCPTAANIDQVDSDSDGTGDECEALPFNTDLDGDGIDNDVDNCIEDPNFDQADSDGDNVGDICDNCPDFSNVNQVDNDGNGVGDACEAISLPPEDVCESKDITGTRIKPNVYFALDNSGSMGGSRWTNLMSAINSKATEISTNFNVGSAYFPGSSADTVECIDLVPDKVINNFNACDIDPGGGTPLPETLNNIRTKKYYEFTPDSFNSTRGKAVIMITDADDDDFSMSSAISASTALKNIGVKVYYMGFAGVNESNMVSLASAGGTTPWYKITDTTSIIAALNSISAAMIQCTVSIPLNGADDDPSRMEVSINNNGTLIGIEPGTPDGWTFDSTNDTLVLNGSSCSDLKDYAAASSDPSKVGVSAKVACIEDCVSVPEFCDGKDNDCNGIPDDGITCECTYEICGDGIDNDCDDLIDEGCPDPDECIPAPEICDGIDNDCDDQVDEGCSMGS